MRKLITSTLLAGSLLVAQPAAAESHYSRILDKEFWNKDVLSAALSVAAESVLTDWWQDDQDNSVDPVDPLEKYNRMMFKFNAKLDDVALQPMAKNYAEHTPELVRLGVRNFFSNIGDVGVLANSALQGKVDQALEDTSRVAINSVVGLGGVIDVATMLDIEKNDEDFGQTLGYWGVPEGPYIVLPLLGPKTMRSAIGTAVDTYLQVETLGAMSEVAGTESIVSELLALNVIDQRTKMLGKETLLEQVALDPYIYAREAYLAYRRCKVADCDKIDYIPADPETDQPSSNNLLEELDMLEELESLED